MTHPLRLVKRYQLHSLDLDFDYTRDCALPCISHESYNHRGFENSTGIAHRTSSTLNQAMAASVVYKPQFESVASDDYYSMIMSGSFSNVVETDSLSAGTIECQDTQDCLLSTLSPLNVVATYATHSHWQDIKAAHVEWDDLLRNSSAPLYAGYTIENFGSLKKSQHETIVRSDLPEGQN
jgi:hypothetical protein